MKSLEKQVDLENIDIPSSRFSRIKWYLYKYFRITKYDFMYSDIIRFNRKINSLGINENVCAIHYAELDLPSNIHGYLYQDMCISYIRDVIMPDDNLKCYFRENVSKPILLLRDKRQADFYASPQCQGVFVMGAWLKRYMIDKMHIAPEKVHCVGAGTDLNYDKLDISGRTGNKILFVGIDFKRKGGDILLAAFSILRERYLPNAELYIAGYKMGKIATPVEGVHYIGYLAGDALLEYYGLCDIFCMPSYLEPYGKTFVEALSCGMPVIARDAFAAPDFIEDGVNGYLLKRDDPEALATMMYSLLSDSHFTEYVKEHMKEYQERFSWDTVARKMLDIISQDEFS